MASTALRWRLFVTGSGAVVRQPDVARSLLGSSSSTATERPATHSGATACMAKMLGRLRRRLHRIATWQTPAAPFAKIDPARRSAAVLLHIPTSDGSGQACHPSVVHAPEGFGGFCYWMANTPYPANSHKLENPELFASHDGLFWEVPAGVDNPLVPPPPGDSRHYHSDPSLLLHDGKLWLYFRTSDEEVRPRRDWLSVIVSSDGRNWSAPQAVLDDDRGALLLSPSVRTINHEFMMWTVEAEAGSAKLGVKRRRSADGFRWSAPEDAVLIWPGAPLEPWHIDVTQVGSELAMIFSARAPSGARTERFHTAFGDGLRWNVIKHDDDKLCGFESAWPYKPSLLPPAPGRPSGWLYTSSAGADRVWYTALRPGPFS